MAFDPVDPRAERYMRALAARHDEPLAPPFSREAPAGRRGAETRNGQAGRPPGRSSWG